MNHHVFFITENLKPHELEQQVPPSSISVFLVMNNQSHRSDTLEWENLTYITPPSGLCRSGERKFLLRDISGYVTGGEVLAIVGPSGAGKTTLLNILAGKVSQGILQGKIKLNGKPRTRSWRHVMGYVEQNEVFLEHLTVNETIDYAAKLRLPKFLSTTLKNQCIENVIEDLSLLNCRYNQIQVVSGGERKRTSIGVELVTSPQFLFLGK